MIFFCKFVIVVTQTLIIAYNVVMGNAYSREWLSGRALPCQGKCRGSESRLPLHKLSYLGKGVRHHSQVVRQRSATPSSPVRIWMVPPTICRCGGIGRRKGLKIPRWQHRTGSSPVNGTRLRKISLIRFVSSFFVYC